MTTSVEARSGDVPVQTAARDGEALYTFARASNSVVSVTGQDVRKFGNARESHVGTIARHIRNVSAETLASIPAASSRDIDADIYR